MDTGPIVQLVMSLIADPVVLSLILACSHTFIEIDCEIFSLVNLFFLLIQERLLSVTNESMCMKYLVKLAQERVWLG